MWHRARARRKLSPYPSQPHTTTNDRQCHQPAIDRMHDDLSRRNRNITAPSKQDLNMGKGPPLASAIALTADLRGNGKHAIAIVSSG
ncbi:hypothetical protein J1614_003908 [Plenodomus biglobosus]|nr:hypothetical protein J1614_003908 [Plenodomus biglobosus]